MKNNIQTKVTKMFNSFWTVEFTIGVQTFFLGDLLTEERAKWYKKQLGTAFNNIKFE